MPGNIGIPVPCILCPPLENYACRSDVLGSYLLSPRRTTHAGLTCSGVTYWVPSSPPPACPPSFILRQRATLGIYSFKQGNKQLSQKLMRGRVLAQGFTILVMTAGLYVAGPPDVRYIRAVCTKTSSKWVQTHETIDAHPPIHLEGFLPIR